jgi:hypothetical protein
MHASGESFVLDGMEVKGGQETPKQACMHRSHAGFVRRDDKKSTHLVSPKASRG